MKVFIFAAGADTGGQGYRIREAFRRHEPSWQVDSLALTTKFMKYPEQISGRAYDRVQAARSLYEAADVVHLRLTLAGWEKLDKGQGKPIVLHHHGTIFRIGHHALATRARRMGAVQVASTLDLTLLEPGVRWLPSPFDLGALRAIRERVHVPSDRIRIAHAPTNRSVKGTRTFEVVVRKLAKEYPIDVDIIEGRPWAECLERKAKADIFYDQTRLGYGNNAVEAWGMGLPVIAGVEDPAVRSRMVETWGSLPFVEASETTLEASLRLLIESRAMREDFGARGESFARRFHDETKVVGLLRDLYRSAPRTVYAPQIMPLSGRERRALGAA